VTDSALALALAGISFALTVIWGGPLIRILRQLKMGDSIRAELRDLHADKAGTPTMGGLLFVLPVIVITIMLNAVSLIGLSGQGRSILVPLGTLVVYGLLGGIDDWQKLGNKASGEGLSGRLQLALQIVTALIIAWGLYAVLHVPEMYIPVFDDEIEIGWLYIPIAAFIIVSSINAVNLTDGLDGMAGLISATCFAAYGIIALLQEQVFLAQFTFVVVGAVFGFLWFNVFPAQLFMGGTGSTPLGATLAVVALMTGHWILLPIIAIIPVAQVLSVVIQVAYFRRTGGKRFFKRSPIHHHFEMSGWSESQVMQRFWLITLMSSLIGVALATI
jgi:phospho-N-acetylmuramoyl-pentapeptide-transferase